MPTWEQILTDWTPERLERLIRDLAARRDPAGRGGIDASTVIAHVTEGYDLGAGAERSRARERILAMIQARVAQLEGMRYIQAKD